MTLKEKLIKNDMKILAISFVVVFCLPFVIFFGIIAWAFLKYEPPLNFDFNQYSGHVVKAEIVDWLDEYGHGDPISTENYRVILTLDENQIPQLLTNLSELDFEKKGPGDPPGFHGRCILLSLNDGTYRVVGRYGYAQYGPNDKYLNRYTSLWHYIRDDDFDDLFEPYLGR